MSATKSRSLDVVPAYDASRTFPCWFTACAGVLSVGILVPVLLAMLHTNGQPTRYGDYIDAKPGGSLKYPPPDASPSVERVLSEFWSLEFAATLLCGPGAFILTLILYKGLKVNQHHCSVPSDLIGAGVRWGIVMAFANVPGYLCGFIIGWHNPHVEIRLALLFASAGAASGAWIGWQAWRATHPNAGFFPQFSLGTLFGGMIALATLFAVFAPAAI